MKLQLGIFTFTFPIGPLLTYEDARLEAYSNIKNTLPKVLLPGIIYEEYQMNRSNCFGIKTSYELNKNNAGFVFLNFIKENKPYRILSIKTQLGKSDLGEK